MDFMTNLTSTTPARRPRGAGLPGWSGRAWFVTAAAGQLAFVAFILAFYGPSTLSGDFAAWNEKPLIDGHIEGDRAGNFMFAAHVFLAAIMTTAGLMQLTPQIRMRAPAFHRFTGRVFLITACILALGGLWLGWIRETRLSMVSLYAISFNALLILAFAAFTLYYAIRRQIAAHQRWAMRLFMVANGVWFLRIAIMAWVILARGPVGMNRTLSGPMDIVMVFGCYLIPLALYELYRSASGSSNMTFRIAVALLVFIAAGVTAVGVFGTVAFMWFPYV